MLRGMAFMGDVTRRQKRGNNFKTTAPGKATGCARENENEREEEKKWKEDVHTFEGQRCAICKWK